jgi:hypothetical protein
MHDAILDADGKPVPPQPAGPAQRKGDPTAGGGALVDSASAMAPGLRSEHDWDASMKQVPPQPILTDETLTRDA